MGTDRLTSTSVCFYLFLMLGVLFLLGTCLPETEGESKIADLSVI